MISLKTYKGSIDLCIYYNNKSEFSQFKGTRVAYVMENPGRPGVGIWGSFSLGRALLLCLCLYPSGQVPST